MGGGVRVSGWSGEGEPEKRSHDKKGLNRGCVAGGQANPIPHQSIGESCACPREFLSVWGLAINQSINQEPLRPAVALAHCTLSRAIPYSNKSLMRGSVLYRTVLAIYQRGPGRRTV